MRHLNLHDPRRRVAFAAAAVLALVVTATIGALTLVRSGQPEPAATPSVRAQDPDGAPAQPQAEGQRQAEADPAAYDISRLRALEPVVASPGTATITGEAAQQPDLYAAEFVRRLLTQDYRQPREAHLQWVQAEAATTKEPLVVGLVPPELRDRLALYSVADASGAATPIPSASEWQGLALQHGYTTVTIDRVEEPFAWTNAVASGRISDPGITGRDVAATVVQHTTVEGQPRTATFSVGISLNLQGPPTRATWGFVAAVSYTSIQVS